MQHVEQWGVEQQRLPSLLFCFKTSLNRGVQKTITVQLFGVFKNGVSGKQLKSTSQTIQVHVI